MKINDELVSARKKKGGYYVRRQREDNVDPSKMSPARRQTLEAFGRANALAYGRSGLVRYAGRKMPRGAAEVGRQMRSRTFPASHVDRKKENQRTLREKLLGAKEALVEYMGEAVAVVNEDGRDTKQEIQGEVDKHHLVDLRTKRVLRR